MVLSEAYLIQRLEVRSRVERLTAIVTQLGECQTEDLEAAGSSPAYRTYHLATIVLCDFERFQAKRW
jgi:hypothetical protein